MDYKSAVAATTEMMRSSTESGWIRLRAYVEERDIRPAESALAVIYPDDVAQLVAVVVVSHSRMLELEIDYPRTLDHASAMSEGTVVSSDDDAQRILEENRDWVEAALDLLADERGR